MITLNALLQEWTVSQRRKGDIYKLDSTNLITIFQVQNEID